ncbi:hypothetical protein VC83_03099 [Pseudogymnoascus destructans]|uniref:SP-RING-type domain-containing protein n=2 Tax=Pseudogymnoascus destructans TaxID=655981 RepID=L8FTJ3_PSED2|nr:uncharacterized protein VC83_03099 [Pseudogymnoascus destructans]ELR04192.1 hypothetical protein GMDG_06614 [Pseudogymnoascus destructans 20631-21]OAF60219.1 hypothetical protein VC83_03099 [Pseudogymnoascus destructans]
MRKRSDKDKTAHAGPGTVQQIASTNSTVNLFLGDSQVRSWMNGTAAAAAPSSTISRAKRTSVLAARGSDNSRPISTSTVLPSPAPSDEPSPAGETDSSRVVQKEKVGMAAQRPLVTSPESSAHVELQAVRRPGTQQSSIVIQQGDIDAGVQAVRSPLMQQRNTSNEPQAVRSPSTQQPPMVQQRNTNNEPHNPWTRQAVLNGYTPQAPAPPAKRRKMTSANHPSLKTMLPLIEQHLNLHGGMQNLARNIERQRFYMLQKACESDDYFYFALHQIFCLYSLDPDTATTLTMPQRGGSVLEAAFQIIGQLIMPNTAISLVHTKFFSVFPNQLSELMYRSDQYRLTVNNVAIFLARLSIEWSKYVPECVHRGYPPLVDELVNRFGLLSPILQHIIFTAARRNMGIPDDEYSAQMEKLFSHDQELHRQMAARVNTAYPPTEREINERNQWQANQYKAVRDAQLHRIGQIRPGEPAHMGPNAARPLQQPNLPEREQSPSNIPPATQAGQPAPIRTTIMPSEVLTASPRSTTVPSPHHYPWQSQTSQGYPITPNQQNMPSQAQTMQQPYQPNQVQSIQHRQGPVNDIVRTASRNASRNAPLVQFPGAAGSAASSPVLTNQPRRVSSSTYNMTIPTIAAMPAGYSSLQPQPQPQPQQKVNRVQLIPPQGYTPPYQFPQPDRSALHQAHLRSPVLKPIDADEGLAANETAHRYYQAVQSFAVKPTTLLDSPLLTELSFAVPKRVFANIAEDKISDLSAPMLREVRQGSLQYRVCCSRMNKDAQMEPSDFVVADTNWPPTIFMEMNDSVIEIRRKSHYGKDRPVDITPHVLERGATKKNTLRVSVPRPPKTNNDILYSIAIEVIEVFRHQQIVDMCLQEQRVTAKEMIEDIRAKLSNSNIDEDDDVALVSANLTIDLADPFTSRIFTIPVRGVRCRHRECFDLETFLISRSTKPQEVACLPDVWKCPLCGGDASPRALRVDDFLVSVREKLERDGELDVKAILVTEDGAWTVKPEALPAERRKSKGGAGSVPRDESERSSPASQSRQGSRAVEVIEVDDD